MKASATQCRHLLKASEVLLAGLDDSHLAIEPKPGMKTAGWLLGHLALTGDFSRHLCGRAPLCPRDWRDKFKPGTQPSSNRDDYPSMLALKDAFHAVYADLALIAAEIDPAKLSMVNPIEAARASFPTVADFVPYVMSGHLGYHLGQLAGWRAAAGLGPRFPTPPE